jgi:hypothetical protein
MDYGFMRASNEDYTKPSTKTDRVIESFDGYTSYLLIVDEVSKYTWIFLMKTKDPPIKHRAHTDIHETIWKSRRRHDTI